MNVEFYRHNLAESDLAAACETMRSLFLTTGPAAARLERAFAGYTGLDHIVGLNSCTAALHLALLALGVGPGDEVATTPMTFIATATAILHTGARPVFVDVEPETALMDLAALEAALTPRTRAVLPVHLYGTLVDMKGLRRIADQRGLKVVEDAAHCVEGERDGVRPGHLGDAACYSFYATKSLTCGEGGALATRDADLAAKVRLLSLHGMSKGAAERYGPRYRHWDMLAEGWKYNLDDIHAALLPGQVARLEAQWQRRDRIARRYDAAFADLAGVTVPKVVGKSARHLYTIWVEAARRDEVLHGLQQRGVGVAVNYRAIHALTFFRERFGYRPEDFPVALGIGRRTISLPLYPKLQDAEVEHVIASVASAVG